MMRRNLIVVFNIAACLPTISSEQKASKERVRRGDGELIYDYMRLLF